MVSELNNRERELVALGASIASNCVPCLEHHVSEARKVGLTDIQIRAAVTLADEVRRVPARRIRATALAMTEDSPKVDGRSGAKCGCAG